MKQTKNKLNESVSFRKEITDLISDIYYNVRDYFGDGPEDLQVAIGAIEKAEIRLTDYSRGLGPNAGDVILQIDIPFGYIDEDSGEPDYDEKVDAKYAKPFAKEIVDEIKSYIGAKSTDYDVYLNVIRARFKF